MGKAVSEFDAKAEVSGVEPLRLLRAGDVKNRDGRLEHVASG